MDIEYALEPQLGQAEFRDLLFRSTLAARRPVEQPAVLEAMLRGATVILTARRFGKLLGVSRAISDRAFCTYLSDLAVDVDFQRQGIGKELIRRTHIAAGSHTTLILLSAPQAQTYYPHIGMRPHESCWTLPPSGPLVPPQIVSPQPQSVCQTQGLPASTNVDQFFDRLAGGYADIILRCFPRYPEMLWALLEFLPLQAAPRRILELGCGTGNLSVHIAERFPEAHVTLVDISTESLEICRRRLGDHARYTFLAGDMRCLKPSTDTYDLILSSIAIHHLTSQEKQELFRSCYGWLDQGGVIALADQFSASESMVYQRHIDNWKRITLSAGSTEQEWQMWMEHQQQHDHHNTLTDHLTWLAQAGFNSMDCPWRYLLWTVVQASK